MNTIVKLGRVLILISVLGILVLLFIPYVNAGSASNASTDCVNFLFRNSIDEFSPSTLLAIENNESLPFVYDDFKRINHYVNLCNFHHEKTGEWMGPNRTFDMTIDMEVFAEYYLKYPDTLPDDD